MATIQEDFDQGQLANWRLRLKDQRDLSATLANELAKLKDQESAGKEILDEIAELAKAHPDEIASGDKQRADAKLAKLAEKRVVLERRIAAASAQISAIQSQIARFDTSKLARLDKIKSLFQRLAG
ncbi:MAG: hypothetical protein ABR861_04900 [Terriglobales bacterium]|jgi:chromosome segregation ATPase